MIDHRSIPPGLKSRLTTPSVGRVVSRLIQTDHELDHVVRLARAISGVSACVICVGTAETWEIVARASAEPNSPTEFAFCRLVAVEGELVRIDDTASDPRVDDWGSFGACAGVPLHTSDGEVFGSLCLFHAGARTITDEEIAHLDNFSRITVDRLALEWVNRQLGITQQRFQSMCRTLPTALVCSDAGGTITFFNPKASELFGYNEREILGESIKRLIPESFHCDYEERMAHRLKSEGGDRIGELKDAMARRKDGTIFPVKVGLSRWGDIDGPRFCAAFLDMTQRQAREARLEYLAHFDHLTGLPNRSWFFEQAPRAIEQRGGAVLILIDLDGFKEVNDHYGHLTGDRLLEAVSERLRAEQGAEVLLARLGGDEFVALVRSHGLYEAVAFGSKLRRTIAEPYLVGDHLLKIDASLGIAMAPEHGTSVPELLANADLALYEAKRCGNGGIRAFQSPLKQRAESRRTMQAELGQAFECGEFELYYQPQIRLSDGTIWGVEVLLRWQHPEHGLLAPGAFLSLLEEMALAGEVGAWVLDTAIAQAAHWQSIGLPSIHVGINLFTTQFRSGKLVEGVRASLARHNFPPHLLELEILETIAGQSIANVVDDLRALRRHGVRIAFDDFGTGYASLSTLREIPVTTLKIDQTFVREMTATRRDAALVEAIVQLGGTFDLTVVAEGVETQEQVARLTAMGCKIGQGFNFARPMPAEAFERYLAGAASQTAGLSRRTST